MQILMVPLGAVDLATILFWIGSVLAIVFAIVFFVLVMIYGMLWLQAFMSGARIPLLNLVGMSLRKVNPATIVAAKIMGHQAALRTAQNRELTSAQLEAHVLAGGDVMRVMKAIIAADRAGIDLLFDRAAAIDLAGRDVLKAVQTSVSPVVIDCPLSSGGKRNTLSAIAKDGIELRVCARVTVRTNLDQLIGGATEETVIARVGQGIISAIGSAESYMEMLELPERISKAVLERNLDTNTAYEIVSIDILVVDIGENIGARLQTETALSDMRVAQAKAESRRAEAIAREQEMRASVVMQNAMLVMADAEIPIEVANAFRTGTLRTRKPKPAATSSHN